MKAVAVTNKIVFLGAVVVPEHLFIEVSKQVERLYVYVGALQSSLEQAAEILQSVSVDLSVTIYSDALLSYQGLNRDFAHKPSGLLRDAQSACDFIGTDSVLAIYNQPNGNPLKTAG